MAVLISQDALADAADAVFVAIKQCRDLDGLKIDFPIPSKSDISFAVLGAMTMLCRQEVFRDDSLLEPREWPRCRAHGNPIDV